MSTISADKLRLEIQIILRNADLNTLSSKKVRQILETKFQCDLTERKKEIDDILMAEITTRDMQPIPIPPIQIDIQQEPQIINAEPAENTTNTPSNDTEKITTEQVTKPPEEPSMEIQQQENRPTVRQSVSSTTAPVYKKPAAPAAASLKIERRRTCYNKELDISDQLAVIVGGHRMPRSEVVKRMWVYFKEHNLLDPINKQWVNCDETLARLFGRRRVRAFGMLKDLSRHMSDPDKYQ